MVGIEPQESSITLLLCEVYFSKLLNLVHGTQTPPDDCFTIFVAGEETAAGAVLRHPAMLQERRLQQGRPHTPCHIAGEETLQQGP